MSARELLKRYEVEINKHQFDLLSPFISEDCRFYFSSGTYFGLEQSRAAFDKTWNLIKDEVYSLSDVEWLVDSEQAAICVYTFRWSGIIEGQLHEGKGRGTSCFRKETDGWKIVHEHLSSFPASS